MPRPQDLFSYPSKVCCSCRSTGPWLFQVFALLQSFDTNAKPSSVTRAYFGRYLCHDCGRENELLQKYIVRQVEQ